MTYRIESRGPLRRDGRPFSVGIVAPAEEIANLEEALLEGWVSPYGESEEPLGERKPAEIQRRKR